MLNAGLIEKLIKELSTKDKEEILKRSYYHSNHFYKIVLKIDDPVRVKYRLHYWNGDAKYTQNPHNHGWKFDSFIIQGALKDTHFVECSTSGVGVLTPCAKYRMDLTTTDDRYHTSLVGSVVLKQVGTTVYRPGDSYAYPDESKIHTSHPLTSETITLLRQQPQSTSENSIYVPTNAQGVAEFETDKHHRAFTMEELDVILTRTLDALQRLQTLRLSKL